MENRVKRNDYEQVPQNLRGSTLFFMQCYYNSRWDLIVQFDEKILVDEYLELCAENIFKTFGNYIPENLRGRSVYLNKIIELGRIDLIVQFDKELLTDEVLEKYVTFLLNQYSVDENIRDNKFLFNKCVESNRVDLMVQFDSELFTDDIVRKYANEILSISGDVPDSLKNNALFLRIAIESGRNDLIKYFDKSLLTDDIIDKYSQDLLGKKENIKYNYFINNDNLIASRFPVSYLIPSQLSDNKLLFKKAMEAGLTEAISQFDIDVFSDDIIEKYAPYILDSVSEFLLFPPKAEDLKFNSKLLTKCFELKGYGLLDRFDKSLFTNDIVEKYADGIINFGIIPKPLFRNTNLFNKCLNLNRVDLIVQFDKVMLTDDIVEKYADDIINLNYIPKSLRESTVLLNRCISSNRIDLVHQFSKKILTPDLVEKAFKPALVQGHIQSEVSLCNANINNFIQNRDIESLKNVALILGRNYNRSFLDTPLTADTRNAWNSYYRCFTITTIYGLINNFRMQIGDDKKTLNELYNYFLANHKLLSNVLENPLFETQMENTEDLNMSM